MEFTEKQLTQLKEIANKYAELGSNHYKNGLSDVIRSFKINNKNRGIDFDTYIECQTKFLQKLGLRNK